MYSGADETRWGTGAYSTSYTGYSSQRYQPNHNLQISPTPPLYRPIQQNNPGHIPLDTTRYGQITGTDHGFSTQAAGQQPQVHVYSTNNDIPKEGKYRDRIGREYIQSETELDRFSRYQSQTEEDYYRQSLGSSRTDVRHGHSTSPNNKHPAKNILKKSRHKVEETAYDHGMFITGNASQNLPHRRDDSFNQSRALNISDLPDPIGMTNPSLKKKQQSQPSVAPYRGTSQSVPPKARVRHRFGQKNSKKKRKRKMTTTIASVPRFQPTIRDKQPVSDRMEENDTESVYMKHELEIRDQQLKVASDLLTKQGEMLKRMESNMNKQILEGMMPNKAPPIPILSPREERNSGHVTDDHWYESGMPFAKRSRFSNMNCNQTHPLDLDTAPFLTKGAKRKLAKRKITLGGAGEGLVTTQPVLQKNRDEEMNISTFDRPEDSEGMLYVTSRGNIREPSFHPPVLDSVDRKFGKYCGQCGLEFFSDFSKHVSNPLHKKRKIRIISGCKPCRVNKHKDYEEYLSHNSMPSHQKIMKIVQGNRDSKYPFQGVKVTCPPFDHNVIQGVDVIKEITSNYCEACEKLIPSKKKTAHLHSLSHYNNWVLHQRIQKFKSLVKRERDLQKTGTKTKETTTCEDKTSKAVIEGETNNKTDKTKITIDSKDPESAGKIDTNKQVPESAEKLKNSSPIAESTPEKLNNCNPTIVSTSKATSESSPSSFEITKSTSEIQKTTNQLEDAVPHDESVHDLTDTNKNTKDVLQESSNVQLSESTEKLKNSSPIAESTPEKPQNCKPTIESTSKVTTESSPSTSEIQKTTNQLEDAVPHDESVHDLTDTNKNTKDVLQESSNVQLSESTEKLKNCSPIAESTPEKPQNCNPTIVSTSKATTESSPSTFEITKSTSEIQKTINQLEDAVPHDESVHTNTDTNKNTKDVLQESSNDNGMVLGRIRLH